MAHVQSQVREFQPMKSDYAGIMPGPRGVRDEAWGGRAQLTTPGLVLTLQPRGPEERTRVLGKRLASHRGCSLVLQGPHGLLSFEHADS